MIGDIRKLALHQVRSVFVKLGLLLRLRQLCRQLSIVVVQQPSFALQLGHLCCGGGRRYWVRRGSWRCKCGKWIRTRSRRCCVGSCRWIGYRRWRTNLQFRPRSVGPQKTRRGGIDHVRLALVASPATSYSQREPTQQRGPPRPKRSAPTTNVVLIILICYVLCCTHHVT